MIRSPIQSGAARLAASVLALAIVAAAMPALAQPANTQSTGTLPSVRRIQATNQDQTIARKVDLGIGKSIIIDLPRDAKEIFVANPAIANAVIRSTRKLFVIGVSSGSTSVYITDNDGQQIAAVEINIGREMGVLERTLRLAIPSASIIATAVQDTIILTGTVENALDAQKAVDIANGFVGNSVIGGSSSAAGGANGAGISVASNSFLLTGKVINSLTVRARDQVMLKVTVAEVKRQTIKQLGVNLEGTWQIAGTDVLVQSANPFALGRQATGNGLQLGNTRNINVKALEQQGVYRTLAEPVLTAISGETAKFTAGGEIPVPNSFSSGTVSNGVRQPDQVGLVFKPYGVSLVFTPVVLGEGRISLRVSTEVTDIDASGQIKFNTFNIPAFRVRRQDTTVELPSGGSLVTAGLIQQETRQVIQGLPGLMNLPVLGPLFRSRDYQRDETELMMIVTPLIAKSNPIAALARPDDGFQDASDQQSILLGRLNRIYGVAGAPRAKPALKGQYGFIQD